MSKNNPFATVQPFQDEARPLDTIGEQGLVNGAGKSGTQEATVAPAIVTTQSWGTDGKMLITACMLLSSKLSSAS